MSEPGVVSAETGAEHRRVTAALVVQVLISAGTYLAAKRAMTELEPLTVVVWRYVLCATLFVALLAFRPGPRLPPRSEWGKIAGLGLLAGPVNQGFFFYGLDRSTPAHAALLYALTPLGVYGWSIVRGREPLRQRAVEGIVLALLGVAVLLLGRGLASARGPLVGDLFILVAVTAWVIYTAEGKPLTEKHGPVRSTSWTMIAGAFGCLGFAPHFLQPDRVASASAVAIACVIFLGVLTSFVAYLLWYYALSRREASKVAVFSNLQPAATALAAWLILGEPLTWEILAGGILVVAGVRRTQSSRT